MGDEEIFRVWGTFARSSTVCSKQPHFETFAFVLAFTPKQLLTLSTAARRSASCAGTPAAIYCRKHTDCGRAAPITTLQKTRTIPLSRSKLTDDYSRRSVFDLNFKVSLEVRLQLCQIM